MLFLPNPFHDLTLNPVGFHLKTNLIPKDFPMLENLKPQLSHFPPSADTGHSSGLLTNPAFMKQFFPHEKDRDVNYFSFLLYMLPWMWCDHQIGHHIWPADIKKHKSLFYNGLFR